MFDRALKTYLPPALDRKIVLLTGPRQVGKTTLAQSLPFSRSVYLTYDSAEDRAILRRQAWARDQEIVIFDELHKLPKWKSYIKGIFDKEGVRPRLLVTGSARLEISRRGGESLAGRHRLFRLHPLTVRELSGALPPEESLDRLLKFGGFPEPFAANDDAAYRLWQRSHLDRIIRGDLVDLENIRNLSKIELLIDLLSERVGSCVSFSSLARDLEISPHTVKNWVEILEWLYILFVVPPYAKNLARAIQREPKIYFYDTGMVQNGAAARLENTVACALLEKLTQIEDTDGRKSRLFYVRDREKREVDFLAWIDRSVEALVEVKSSDDRPSSSLRYFAERIAPRQSIQVVKDLSKPLQYGSIEVRPAAQWLATL